MLEAIKEFYYNVGKRTSYKVWVGICAIISYGFSFFNRTVSIDGLSDDRYYFNYKTQSGLIAGKRWGFYIYRFLFSTERGTVSADRIMAVLFMILAAFTLCVIAHYLSNNSIHFLSYPAISAIFISFPLINEISEYPGTYAYIGLEFFLMSLSVLVYLTSGWSTTKKIIVESLLLTLITAGYESGVFAYITLVLLVLCLNIINKTTQYPIKNYIVEGGLLAIPLVIAVVIKYLIGHLLIVILGAPSGTMGASGILWGQADSSLWITIKTNIYLYFARGVVYLPLTVFVTVTIIAIVCLLSNKCNRALGIIAYLIALVSVFAQSFVSCSAMPYRTAQTVWVFTSFSIFIICKIVCVKWDKRVLYALFGILLLVSLKQSLFLNELLNLNNLRSENEAYLARQIGYRITTECDTSKSVVIVGSYYEGEWIDSAMSIREPSILLKIDNKARVFLGLPKVDSERPVDTNVRSYLSWGVRATGMEDLEVLKWYFSYWGYDINVLNEVSSDEKSSYEAMAHDMGMKRLDIKELDQIILVYLG